MVTVPQITAARQYAPPLVTVSQLDRRGAKLRCVNRRAVDYARNAGMGVETVYPGGMSQVRRLAPARGSPEAAPWVKAVGLRASDVYPPSSGGSFAGETVSRKRRWGWTAVGLFVGACLAGPLGAMAGGLIGVTR
jgi:hypothetical protein